MIKNISVISTVYNDQKEILNLLDDITNQTQLPKEIVIADGGSSDDTISIIKEYQKNTKVKIKLIAGKRLNISQGFNEAVKNTENDIIIVMNTGHKYDKNFIQELNNTYEKEKTDIVYAPIRGKKETSFAQLYCSTFLNGEAGGRIPSNHGVLIKKDVFKQIGLFYEHFIYAGEDAEFFNRAQKEKLTIACADNAYLYWDVPKTKKEFKKQIKNYTIAKMQIESISILKKYKMIYLIFIDVFFLILSLCLKKYMISMFFLILGLLLFAYKILKTKGFQKYCLLFYRQCLELKITIKNIKKLKKEYKVKEEKIEKLK